MKNGGFSNHPYKLLGCSYCCTFSGHIYTNFKTILSISKPYIPVIANVIGLIISIFIAHRNNLWAGFFMGVFYGNAAVGLYASLKTHLKAFRGER